ncbi:MAG: peptidoglycan-binding protein [Hyphomicrobiales bacterium]
MTAVGPFIKGKARELSITFGVCALVGTAMINAVFLQTSKHPAPLFKQQEARVISSDVSNTITKPNEINLTGAEYAPVANPLAANPLVVEIQRHLAARGYYNSEFDGLMGARTKAAIGVYQRAFDITVTNEASRSLLEHIRLSIPDKKYHAKARQRVAEATVDLESIGLRTTTIGPSDLTISDPKRIKEVQQALTRIGFNLAADGVAGRNTKLAIVEFKKRRGLKPDERITLALFNELMKLKKL